MTYRTILVDLTAGDTPDARLRVARALAARFGAALVGLHVTAPVGLALAPFEGGWAAYLPPEVLEAQRAAGQEVKDRARAAFELACDGDPRAAWREAEGYPSWTLVRAAHAADLVVAARDDLLELVEQIVTATGVPVLMLPPDAPTDVGRVALVAWNASREATRAAHDALPFLHAAERVVLCAIGDPATADPGLEDAAAMLDRHGVAVQVEQVPGPDSGAGAGEALLARAAEHGADLLVMGAYGHSRLHEFVLGGTTRRVLREATLPVLFSS